MVIPSAYDWSRLLVEVVALLSLDVVTALVLLGFGSLVAGAVLDAVRRAFQPTRGGAAHKRSRLVDESNPYGGFE